MHIKNFEDYKHYTDGRPMHWIKVMKSLIDDIEWCSLSGDAAKLLINLWLLATEDGGQLPDTKIIAFRLRTDEKKVIKLLSELVHWIVLDDTDRTKPYESVPKRCLDKIREDIDQRREDILLIEKADTADRKTPSRVSVVNESFETFWKAYPRKVGKPNALKAWKSKKLNESIDIILASLERWKASRDWTKDGGQFIPHPATWLNREGWNDEVKASLYQDDDNDINF